MTLRDPLWLLLLALLPWLWWRTRSASASAVCFSPASLWDSAARTGSWRTRLLFLPRLLRVVAAAAMVLALSRPVERVALAVEREGVDIVLAVDVSSSMARQDLERGADRLEVAKAAARRFVAGRPADRIGLIRFARFCDVVCPTTLDHEALDELLAELSRVEHEGPEDQTGIGGAVARAVQILRGGALAEQATSDAVVILVTDGEENVATAAAPQAIGPLQAAQLAAHHGVSVHVITVGGDDLDTSQVEALAERTGGTFHRARRAATVAEIYAAIAELERAPAPEPRFAVEDRLLPWLLLSLLALLLAEAGCALGVEEVR